MTDQPTSGKPDPAAEADAWMIVLSEPVVPFATRRAFVQWLKRSPVHVEEYLRVASIRSLVGAYQPTDRVSPQDKPDGAGNIIPWPSQRQSITDQRKPRWGWSARLAAVIAAGVFVVAIGLGVRELYDPMEVIEASTARGDQKTLELPDGTQLVLNTSSSVSVTLRRSSRVVAIHHGQVYLDVAEDEDRPFKVVSRDAVFTDIGTRFDVYVRPRDTLVTVLDGHVLVSSPDKDDQADAGSEDVEPKLISQGQRAAVDLKGRVRAMSPVKEPLAMAWQQQRLEFDDMPLLDIAREFNRYNAMRIDVVDAEVENLRLSGSFMTSDTESFLAVAESLPGVVVHRVGPRYVKIIKQ